MLHIVINPTAGKGRAGRLQEQVAKRLAEMNIPHNFHFTQNRMEATDIVRRLTEDIAGDIDIVAMGGDGTLNEVLNGVVDPEKVRLGLIPCGSGNDFAAVAGIPEDVNAAIDVIARGTARYTDYMQCGNIRGINAIGTGIDVDILRRRAKAKILKGSLCYLVSLVASAVSYKGCIFTEETDKGSVPHHAFIACAGNGKRMGGGISLCPDATIDDGLLDIVIVDNLKLYQLPGAFLKLMTGKILEHPHTVFHRSSRMKVVSSNPMPIQIDGEIYEDMPFNVEIIHNKLRVYRP